jgi:uncharacterized repeat protein (TIGR01451 family)
MAFALPALLAFFPAEAQVIGTGNGLCAAYYSGENFNTFYYNELDPTINFNWPGNGVSPNNGSVTIPNGDYSVKWTGMIQASYSEPYTFCTVTDDGGRLWINGIEITNGWVDQAATSYCGSINLVAGQYYNIEMDYYENGVGYASAQLVWSSPSTPATVVPQSQLYCSCLSPAKSVSPAVASVGSDVTYVITNTDCGSAVTGAMVWDTLPSYVTYVSSSPPPTSSANPFYLWNIGSVAASQVYSVTITAQVTSGTNGQVVNNWSANTAGGLPPEVSNDASFSIYNPGTQFVKTASPSMVSPGSAVTYNLDFFNPAPAPVTGFALQVDDGGQAFGSYRMNTDFNIINNSGASANIADFTIKMWIAEAISPSQLGYGSYYGGAASDNSWNGPSVGITAVSLAQPVTYPANRQAAMEIDITTSTADTLNSGVTWGGIETYLAPTSIPLQNYANYFSQDPGAAYVPGQNYGYALYYQGRLVYGTCEPGYIEPQDPVPANVTYV